jgi:2-C-methyl-D-erythritol 4-phosphate cytidylyltransferase
MRASGIIVAAGTGNRLGLGEPKAFVKVGGRTMLAWSLAALSGVTDVVEAVIAVPPGFENAARTEANHSPLDIPVKITPGGSERQHSVRIALALTNAESEVVVIHDAARPFAPARLFEACLAAAERSGGALAAIAVADTLKRAERGLVSATVARAGLWQAQTPQAFRRALLVSAHERALREGVSATDDADLVERLGGRVEIVEGSALNLKITTPDDLRMAEALAASDALR